MWSFRKRSRTSSSSSTSTSSRPTLLRLQLLFVFVTVWVICITVSLTQRAACRDRHSADSLWATLKKLAPEAVVGGAASGRRWYPPGGGGLINFLGTIVNNTGVKPALSGTESGHDGTNTTQHRTQVDQIVTGVKNKSGAPHTNDKTQRKLLELDSVTVADVSSDIHVNFTASFAHPGNKSTCDQFPETLVGLLRLPTSTSEWSRLLRGHMSMSPGGHWSPTECVARQRVAIIVPYQNRPHHLRTFLLYMHPFLQRQQLEYTLYIVEQIYPETFNRAGVLNAGFLEVSRRSSAFDCVIFHDVDLLPEHDHNKYECGTYPRHLASHVNTTSYRLSESNVGGVLAMTPDTVRLVNGFSTTFWGWGGEDDDMYMRISRHQHLRIERPGNVIGRYVMLPHGRDVHNPLNPNRLRGATYRGTRYTSDGLNSIKYDVQSVKQMDLFTHITISLQPPES